MASAQTLYLIVALSLLTFGPIDGQISHQLQTSNIYAMVDNPVLLPPSRGVDKAGGCECKRYAGNSLYDGGEEKWSERRGHFQ